MKEKSIVVELTFLETAKESFNFPITNSIRTSFWLSESNGSTFSEIKLQNEILEIGEPYKVSILLMEQDFLKNKLQPNVEFNIGVYPTKIGYGKILKIDNDIR